MKVFKERLIIDIEHISDGERKDGKAAPITRMKSTATIDGEKIYEFEAETYRYMNSDIHRAIKTLTSGSDESQTSSYVGRNACKCTCFLRISLPKLFNFKRKPLK